MPERPSDFDELLAFVAHALARHARERQRNGQRVPPAALSVATWCLDAARSGTEAPKVEPAESPAQAGPVERSLLLTIGEAAKLLSVSVRSIRNMLADGRLEPVQLGRSVRVRRVEVEALALPASTSTRFRDQIEAKDDPDGNAA